MLVQKRVLGNGRSCRRVGGATGIAAYVRDFTPSNVHCTLYSAHQIIWGNIIRDLANYCVVHIILVFFDPIQQSIVFNSVDC